jgi:hypothetical protein
MEKAYGSELKYSYTLIMYMRTSKSIHINHYWRSKSIVLDVWSVSFRPLPFRPEVPFHPLASAAINLCLSFHSKIDRSSQPTKTHEQLFGALYMILRHYVRTLELLNSPTE